MNVLWIVEISALFLLVLILIFIIFQKTRSERQRLDELVKNRTAELVFMQKDLIDALKKADAANKAKSIFLAKMSHEIRTPMNAIIGMAELALREDVPAAAYGYIDTIKHSGAHLLSIINDVLDFSKIESGKLELTPVNYYLSSLLNDVINIIKIRIGNSSVKFNIETDSSLPNGLFGDETRIRQILLNILNNAVKYTEKGCITLKVSGEENENDINLIIEVKDTGRGIKEEDLRKLFNDFAQFDLENNKGIEGTGLGLAISKNLAKAMNGSIDVSSEYGKGSVFTITLPQIIHDHQKMGTLEKPNNGQENNAPSISFLAPQACILIVDDINTNLQVARGLLSPYKMQIDLCVSGREAVINAGIKNYDLIFMDHMMPEMDGMETVARIRKSGNHVPIVALTANAVSGTREMFLENGFNDFLSKPIDMVKLNTILEKWIPEEKQNKILLKNPQSNEVTDLNIQTELKIEGINIKKGLSMVGGKIKSYMNILSVFYKDSIDKSEKIKHCFEEDTDEIRNIQLVITHIHALKSAAANIGADALSQEAKELEEAGRNDDVKFIKTGTKKFLNNLNIVLKNIEKAGVLPKLV